MIDEAGAAPAAAEPIAQPQGSEAGADAGTRQAEPIIDRSKETARASIDRAFAEIDKEEATKDKSVTGKEPATTDTRERDENGRFKAKDTTGEPAPIEGKPDAKASTEKSAATALEPPARFSADAKAVWATVPDSVKGEVNRAIRELNEGLGQYQQFFAPLKPYYDLAQKHETTVHETLDRYVTLDFALLSQKPEERLSAIEKVLDYAGISPRDYAAFVMGQKPDEAQSSNDRTIRELRQEIAGLKNQLGGVSKSIEQRREDEVLKQIEAFAEENPRLKEAEFLQVVTRLLSAGLAADLKSAYDMADRLKPAPVKDTQTTPGSYPGTQKPPAAQTRNGNLSITGGPGSGSNPAKRKAPATARESVDNAFASLGLG